MVRFDRGDGINAMSPEAMRQLTVAARSFEDDDATSIVVLTGGAKSFTAGFDLKDPEGRPANPWTSAAAPPPETRTAADAGLAGMEQITIGAIEGFCVEAPRGARVALRLSRDVARTPSSCAPGATLIYRKELA